MTIFEEVEKTIAELPPEQASSLKIWLSEFRAARQYKKIKAFTQATKTIAEFRRSHSNSLSN